MNLRRFTLGFILVFILSVMTFEVVLRIQRGLPPLESNPLQFNYRYVEIYERFFKKVTLADGSMVYKTSRPLAIPQQFPVHRDRDTKRIFVLGGSVAACFDRNIFEDLLEALISEMKFEVINCGMGAYDTYRVSLVQKEILNYNPDLIILMSGNNEFFTPV